MAPPSGGAVLVRRIFYTQVSGNAIPKAYYVFEAFQELPEKNFPSLTGCDKKRCDVGVTEDAMRSGTFIFAEPEWRDELPSTSDTLKERVAAGLPVAAGSVLAVRRQTRGRGRMGNAWLSSREGDLTFSFLWEGDRDLPAAATLPLACALGVRDFLASPPLALVSLCKWPNDVITAAGKICGILSESLASAEPPLRIVVGIGVNLARDGGRDGGLAVPVASVAGLTGVEHDPVLILPHLLACLENRIAIWEGGGFAALRRDYENALWGVGREVTVRRKDGRTAGIIGGVGGSGELLLRSGDGEEIAVSSVAALDFGPGL